MRFSFPSLAFAGVVVGVMAALSAVSAEAATYYCPHLSVGMQRGSRDSSSGAQVSELQKFLSAYYGVDSSQIVTGYFGPITASYVTRFQSDQALPAIGLVGPLTRAGISRVCGGGVSTTPSTGVTQTPTNTPTWPTPTNPVYTPPVAPTTPVKPPTTTSSSNAQSNADLDALMASINQNMGGLSGDLSSDDTVINQDDSADN